jgi:hypothetical protein
LQQLFWSTFRLPVFCSDGFVMLPGAPFLFLPPAMSPFFIAPPAG